MEKWVTEKNGVTFKNIRSPETSIGTSCVGNEKVILTGKPKIVITEGSYKFGKELQFSLACKKEEENVKTIQRNNTIYNCVEINMPLDQGIELIKEFLKDFEEGAGK